MGSKRRILDDLLAYFPKVDNFVEPFFGGGNVGLACIEKGIAKRYFFSDLNPDLMDFWMSLKNDFPLLLTQIRRYHDKNNAQDFNKIRHQHLHYQTDRGARFFYLVRNSYRGLWRVNLQGEFNAPFSTEKKGEIDEKQMAWISTLLNTNEVWFMCYDYREVLKKEYMGSTLVYLDPPYYKTYGGYTKDSFNKHDQVVLHEWFIKMRDKGYKVVESNSDTPFIRDLYKDCDIYEIAINHNANFSDSSELTSELLILSRDQV